MKPYLFVVLWTVLAVTTVAHGDPIRTAGSVTKEQLKNNKAGFKTATKALSATKLRLYLENPDRPKKPGKAKANNMQFSACAVLDESDEKSFILRYTKRNKSKTTIKNIEIKTSFPKDWSLTESVQGTDLNRKTHGQFELTFNPKEPMVSEATLVIEMKYSGRTGTFTAEVPLIGDGTPCPTAKADDGSYLGEATDPKIAIGAGKVPPLPKKIIEVCISAHLIKPTGWDEMNDAQKKQVMDTRVKQIDAMIAEANAIWQANRSGVKFKLKKPIKIANKLGDAMDAKCLDIYFDPSKPKGAGETRTQGMNVNDLPNIPTWLKQTKYGRKLAKGDRISISLKGKARDNGSALAHELGHALGLGNGPDSKDHREVDDWDKKIDKAKDADSRLMRHENPGKELRKREVELVREVAQHMADVKPQCEKAVKEQTGQHFVPPNELGDLRYATIISRPDTVDIRAAFSSSITLQPVNVLVELDLDNNGDIDSTLYFNYRDGIWVNESTGMFMKAAHARFLETAWSERSDAKVPEAWAIEISMPRESLGLDVANIGWNIRIQVPRYNSQERIPSQTRLALFDITSPWIKLQLSPESRVLTVRRGENVNLVGHLTRADTFSGTLAARLDLSNASTEHSINAGTLIQPIDEQFNIVVKIPGKLEPGQYAYSLKLRCESCRVEDQVEGELTIE